MDAACCIAATVLRSSHHYLIECHWTNRPVPERRTYTPIVKTMAVKPNDLQNAEKTPKVTSGRSGGVISESGGNKAAGKENEYEPSLRQGQTESEAKKGEETDRAKQMKSEININGGQQVDPAYREVGAGGDAGNEGNLGLDKGKGTGKAPNKGRDAKL